MISQDNFKNNLKKYPLNSIKGIGKKREDILNKLGIDSLNDLITFFPREYEDRSNIEQIKNLMNGQKALFKGRVKNKLLEFNSNQKISIQKTKVFDLTGEIEVIWYNQKYLKYKLFVGKEFYFWGKMEVENGKLNCKNPEIVEIDSLVGSANPILPVYKLTQGISQNVIRKLIKSTIDNNIDLIREIIPNNIKEKFNIIDKRIAIKTIHYPEKFSDLEKARYALVFEELFILSYLLRILKENLKKEKGNIFNGGSNSIKKFISNLPFELTKAQLRVIDEVIKDMEDETVMNRLIQGDVGSGKTVVAVTSILKAIKSGFQSALMAPTDILARQHYYNIQKLLDGFGIRVALLSGKMNKKEKDNILNEIKNNNIDLIIGTHALFQDKVEFANLGLIVTDEQHRFGVKQREKFGNKGYNCDILIMSATPIPRTIGLILYGDMDISIIDETPKGRDEIETYVVDEGKRRRINSFIKDNLNSGGQVYIVCPTIEESENERLKDVVSYTEELKILFDKFNVEYIHGKLSNDDKNNVMNKFVNNEIQVLVSTTVIEVGVDVPNANIILVENAERFGLSQLHQLRGRVGRGTRKSYCILMNNSKNKNERLEILKNTNDGFVISEKDLKLRGPGDFFGIRQHGAIKLRIAEIINDIKILKDVNKALEMVDKKDFENINFDIEMLRNFVL